MYKFKYKAQNEEPQVFYFNSLQEVTDYIKLLCDAKTLQQVLEVQKESNIRFYLTYKAN